MSTSRKGELTQSQHLSPTRTPPACRSPSSAGLQWPALSQECPWPSRLTAHGSGFPQPQEPHASGLQGQRRFSFPFPHQRGACLVPLPSRCWGGCARPGGTLMGHTCAPTTTCDSLSVSAPTDASRGTCTGGRGTGAAGASSAASTVMSSFMPLRTAGACTSSSAGS